MERFLRLASLVGYVITGDDRCQATHFKKGLKGWILNHVTNIEFEDVADCVNAARRIETMYKGDYRKRNRNGDVIQYSDHNNNKGINDTRSNLNHNLVQKNSFRPMCNSCGKLHRGICYHTTGGCFGCGSVSHKVKDCHKKRICFISRKTSKSSKVKIQAKFKKLNKQLRSKRS